MVNGPFSVFFAVWSDLQHSSKTLFDHLLGLHFSIGLSHALTSQQKLLKKSALKRVDTQI
jgi:hypothetical protein